MTPSTEQRIFYLYHNHTQEGPYSLFELTDQINHVQTNTETKVFCVGWDQWMRYEDIGSLQDICAARRQNPATYQSQAIQAFFKHIHHQQLRKASPGSYAQFRFSTGPLQQNPEQRLVPPPNTFPLWAVLLTGAVFVGCGVLLTFILR